MNHVYSGHHLEQFAGDVGGGSNAARRKIDHAWMGLGIGNELGDRFGGKHWFDQHDKRPAHDSRDWRYVADEVEIELFIERRVDRVRRIDQQERIAVRRCPHDRLRANIGATARTVLDKTRIRPVWAYVSFHQLRTFTLPFAQPRD
jgi:hypothetical protein